MAVVTFVFLSVVISGGRRSVVMALLAMTVICGCVSRGVRRVGVVGTRLGLTWIRQSCVFRLMGMTWGDGATRGFCWSSPVGD